ncbi:MAG: peptidoglycan-binding protein LysM [Saprospiraceae bacterium]|nr:peptidoglycan-binding protein LysM [Bacteroidia bacterium]NNE14748.1 peptidoglycan-binding protein LysM [Saprospiraceae bacterium]NNL91711.1 peptidoglycan-binding protein LysM [Saprospiraceae bacterium]
MGLFSFIKGAGKKLFGKKEEVVAAPVELSKSDALKAELERLGLCCDVDIDFSDHISVSGTAETNAEREKIILTLGNVEGVGSVSDNISVTNPEPESTFHEVKSGDTLSKISKDVYGDPMKYNAIFEANQPMLTHPDKIYPGQILRIPVL